MNGDTFYAYDLLGHVTLLRDATGQETRFVYDDLGRLVETIDPIVEAGLDKTDKVLLYDEAGNVLLTEDRLGQQTRHSYDNLNRRVLSEYLEAIYSDTGVLRNKYLRGVVVDEIVNGYTYHSSDPNDWSNYTYHHDHLNSVTALTGHAGSTEETTRFDAFGAPLNLTIPGTGNELLYTGRVYDRATGISGNRIDLAAIINGDVSTPITARQDEAF